MNVNVRPEAGDEARWFMGTSLKILVSASEGNDDLCVVEHKAQRGESPPLHVHRNEDEIFFVIEGQVRIDLDGKTRYLGDGEACVAPKGVAHTYRVESALARLLTITRGHDFETMLRSLSRPAGGPGLPPRAEPTPEMVAILTEACRRNHIDIVGPPIA